MRDPHFLETWRGRALVAAALVIGPVMFTGGEDVLFPGEAWAQPSRAIGEPVTGYWRFAPQDGCYAGSALMHHGSDKIVLFGPAKAETLSTHGISILSGRRVRVDYRDGTSATFQDHGDRLEWLSFDHWTDEGQTSANDDMPGDLINCGSYGLLARLAMFGKRRPFSPRDYAIPDG